MHRSLLVCTCLISTAAFGQTYQTWRDYSGGADSAQYSALRQINRSNVGQLQIAWNYPNRRRSEVLLQPDHGRRPDVCAGEEQLHRRAGRPHRQRDLDLYARPRDQAHHQSRHQLLGEQGPLRPPPAVRQQPLPARHRRAHRQADSVVRRRRPRRSETRPRPRSQDASPWCNPPRPAASSRTC